MDYDVLVVDSIEFDVACDLAAPSDIGERKEEGVEIRNKRDRPKVSLVKDWTYLGGAFDHAFNVPCFAWTPLAAGLGGDASLCPGGLLVDILVRSKTVIEMSYKFNYKVMN